MNSMSPDEALEQLASLYRKMDQAYADLARAIGLTCQGCADSCCLSRFHHHTVIEQLYLSRGLETLPADVRYRMVDRARGYVADAHQVGAALPCPLYENGRCALYEYRPMICRLHGVPWVLHRGRLAGQAQPGCPRAMQLIAEASPTPSLDRTPLYAALAGLERRVREMTGRRDPVKLTIADMLLRIASEEGW